MPCVCQFVQVFTKYIFTQHLVVHGCTVGTVGCLNCVYDSVNVCGNNRNQGTHYPDRVDAIQNTIHNAHTHKTSTHHTPTKKLNEIKKHTTYPGKSKLISRSVVYLVLNIIHCVYVTLSRSHCRITTESTCESDARGASRKRNNTMVHNGFLFFLFFRVLIQSISSAL